MKNTGKKISRRRRGIERDGNEKHNVQKTTDKRKQRKKEVVSGQSSICDNVHNVIAPFTR